MEVNIDMDLFEQMVQATLAGDEERCVTLARQAMEQGIDPFKAIQKGFAHGMHIVGDKFARLECFLPEVMVAADAMNARLRWP